jgi:hypothetical protein
MTPLASAVGVAATLLGMFRLVGGSLTNLRTAVVVDDQVPGERAVAVNDALGLHAFGSVPMLVAELGCLFSVSALLYDLSEGGQPVRLKPAVSTAIVAPPTRHSRPASMTADQGRTPSSGRCRSVSSGRRWLRSR